ncbi:hypothetical protein PFDSM3638_05380 [Pyrococcus furiosus DSM 3638]|uniref:Uncharacterized protein n=3 Tax=Pyrococcus furiosus TaxID=2261 RepID=A0A5C0XPU2_PYRFU|nr:membrane protein [Pyrococcus furiosus]AAL81197.1 hypothetical protein PF1073 [Pyrococcus furiosus DSM 3638]AFN03867.1 hypothetical protein PFC_04590 [Pyrococcus furiosus COM1]QEK78732.1 hypothetical protein PFDSM3638_05380 [Pyrococcus furiosus DSM 3638]
MSEIRFKIRDYLKAITGLLLVIWLFKGWLGLEKYNEYMVWAIIGLIVIVEVLGVGRWFGVTLSGIIFSLAKAAFLISLFLFVGKWLGIPEDFPVTSKMAFAYFVVLSIAGILVGGIETPRIRKKEDIIPKVEKKAYEFNDLDFGDVKVRGEGKAYPLKFGRKRVGWAIEGSVEVEAQTPLGSIRRKLISPVVIWTSQDIKGRKVTANENFVRTVEALLHQKSLRVREDEVALDLGILKVYDSDNYTYVKMPFLEIVDTPSGSEVKIGPLKIRDGRPRKIDEEMVTIEELRNGFRLTKIGSNLRIKTEDYDIEIENDKISYRSGSEKLTIAEDYVAISSNGISVSVGKDYAKLRIEDSIISARNGVVKIRIGGKTYTLNSREAYKKVIEKAKDIVKIEGEEVIEGLGIDRTRVRRKIKELVEELMNYLGGN